MTPGFVATLIGRAVLQTLMIGGPLLGLSLGVGLLVSIFQATTTIQEQTLTFVPKIVVVLGALILLSNWMIASMIDYTMNLFGMIPDMVLR
jgi:flagellar biosynthetic protein FliQ